MGRGGVALIAVVLIGAVELEASAQEVCDVERLSMPVGPLSVTLLDGRLGAARRVCPRTEVVLAGDLYLAADLANFYGNIHASAVLAGSFALGERAEIFYRAELFRYQTVISSIAAEYTGSGYTSVGLMRQLWQGRGLVLGLAARLVLPTTSGLNQNTTPLALDAGVNLAWRAHRTVRIHAALTLGGSLQLSLGPVVPRGGVWVHAGVDWHPLRWLAIVAELDAGFGYRGGVDAISARLGFRFALGDRVGIELGALYPFVGAERGLLAAALSLSWRFD